MQAILFDLDGTLIDTAPDIAAALNLALQRASLRAVTLDQVRGWIGDSPLIHLDCTRLRALGWEPKLTIAQALGRTLDWLDANPWVYETRAAR